MSLHSPIVFALCALRFFVLGTAASLGSDSKRTESKPTTAERAHKAAESGLKFLEADAKEWRAKKSCASCHHGVLTVWAMSEAKSSGYPVAPELLKELTSWTMERLKDVDKPRDSRRGFNMVNTPALFLSILAQTNPKQEAVSSDLMKRIDGHLLRHQETNGSWAWTLAPPANRFPPVLESDEVATIWGYLSLDPKGLKDAKDVESAQAGRKKAVVWLANSPPTETTQAAGLRLLLKSRTNAPATSLQSEIDKFNALQNRDGGWGQLKGLPSDAYATGQALYFLRLVGMAAERPELQKGVAFLVANQLGDGSWPMTPRAQPGCKPASNPVPIIHFGSAWAVIGLARVTSN